MSSSFMIGYLSGTVMAIDADQCIINVQGVGYVVRTTRSVLDVVRKNEKIDLWIEHMVHDGASHLFGFVDDTEQKWFGFLVAVPGVGGRVALNILSALPPVELCHALRTKNSQALRSADGVGPRLANRLVTELHPKADAQPIACDAPVLSSTADDAVMALVALGYTAHDAEKSVGIIIQETGSDDVSFIVGTVLKNKV